jgi:hypothetical protein
MREQSVSSVDRENLLIDIGAQEAAIRTRTVPGKAWRNQSTLFRDCTNTWNTPATERSDRRGSMGSSDLQSIAERGLSSFLQAVAEVTPDEDLKKAGECWIRAMETTDWNPGEGADRFICHVTANALAICAER